MPTIFKTVRPVFNFPMVYVHNNTTTTIPELYFTYEGLSIDSSLKKIKPNKVKSTAISIKNLINPKPLYMYFLDENNTKHDIVILENLSHTFIDSIHICAESINEDGSLKITSYICEKYKD
ncbi:hypothetical protein SAMN02745163_03211 [Clostridium cavendishii DSM 21758]|uniref:Uncharacterized protein n=1 Tax=Clostridium cavendishii DSM 21758 TaxID=1121302 RepID=A0A1M6PNE9_9CLOT|nr:hypothetical protein [Clostridium cavendishii]SHK09486.1 hypothetical protein SAMN02745163_03211 [Clostridium cavendishii DSM 21758]